MTMLDKLTTADRSIATMHPSEVRDAMEAAAAELRSGVIGPAYLDAMQIAGRFVAEGADERNPQ